MNFLATLPCCCVAVVACRVEAWRGVHCVRACCLRVPRCVAPHCSSHREHQAVIATWSYQSIAVSTHRLLRFSLCAVVLNIGYGTAGSTPYWILKNSCASFLCCFRSAAFRGCRMCIALGGCCVLSVLLRACALLLCPRLCCCSCCYAHALASRRLSALLEPRLAAWLTGTDLCICSWLRNRGHVMGRARVHPHHCLPQRVRHGHGRHVPVPVTFSRAVLACSECFVLVASCAPCVRVLQWYTSLPVRFWGCRLARVLWLREPQHHRLITRLDVHGACSCASRSVRR